MTRRMLPVAVGLVTLVSLAWPLSVMAGSSLIEAGDRLFVQAEVPGCGKGLQIVEYVTVTDSGEAQFFGDVVIAAAGKTPPEVAALLADALAPKQGRRPQTLRILLVPADDDKAFTIFGMSLLEFRKQDCRDKHQPSDLPMWRYDFRIASLPASGNPALAP